jgi:hypothetical protein
MIYEYRKLSPDLSTLVRQIYYILQAFSLPDKNSRNSLAFNPLPPKGGTFGLLTRHYY